MCLNSLKSLLTCLLASFLDGLHLMASTFSNHHHYFFNCTPALYFWCVGVPLHWFSTNVHVEPCGTTHMEWCSLYLLDMGLMQHLITRTAILILNQDDATLSWNILDFAGGSGLPQQSDVGNKWWNAFGLCQVTHIWDLSAALGLKTTPLPSNWQKRNMGVAVIFPFSSF